MQEGKTDQIMQEKSGLFSEPYALCPSKKKASYICLNPQCEKPSLHCSNCKQCQHHILECCSIQRLETLNFVVNKHNQRRMQMLRQIGQLEERMMKILMQHREKLQKQNGLTSLNKDQINLLEKIYSQNQEAQIIQSKTMNEIYQKLIRTKNILQYRSQEFIDYFKRQLQKITDQIIKLQDYTINKYSEREHQMDSIIIKENMHKQFIHQSLKYKKRVKKLQLIFRASEQNFSAAQFHNKCDNINHTLVVMKTEFDKIIAGYTPLRWNSIPKGFVNDPTNASFLLSIDLKQKMSLVDNTKAIYCDPNRGPIFGEGKDISIDDKCNSNNSQIDFPKSYNNNQFNHVRGEATWKKFSGATQYSCKIVDYQVFKVI